MRAFYFRSFIAIVRGGERMLGPRFLFPLLLPLLAPDLLRRSVRYRDFKRLRKNLPDSFRRGSALRHYIHMIVVWNESLAAAALYDRLGSPAWATRIVISGTPPDKLEGWGERPVIVAFLHSGGFALIKSWLRARGIPTMSLGRALPGVYAHMNGIREAGDALYGHDGLPHAFVGPHAMREAIRAIRPGRVLTIALDGGMPADKLLACEVNSHTLHLLDGAARLAALTNAILLPVSVRRTGPLRFAFRFGEPAPDAPPSIGATRNAMQHLARELWEQVEKDPGSIGWTTLSALMPKEPKGWDWP